MSGGVGFFVCSAGRVLGGLESSDFRAWGSLSFGCGCGWVCFMLPTDNPSVCDVNVDQG